MRCLMAVALLPLGLTSASLTPAKQSAWNDSLHTQTQAYRHEFRCETFNYFRRLQTCSVVYVTPANCYVQHAEASFIGGGGSFAMVNRDFLARVSGTDWVVGLWVDIAYSAPIIDGIRWTDCSPEVRRVD